MCLLSFLLSLLFSIKISTVFLLVKENENRLRASSKFLQIPYSLNPVKKDDDDNTKLFEIISIKKYEHNLPDVHILESTIYSRLRRDNTNNVERGLVSPMAEVEPTLCHLLKYAPRMGQYVSQHNTTNMTNEIIERTPIASNLRRLWYSSGHKRWMGMVCWISKMLQGGNFEVHSECENTTNNPRVLGQ